MPLFFLWEWLLNLYMYARVQKNYPQPGMLCQFGKTKLECMVVSNCYGNRGIVLHVIDPAWGGAYILISYCRTTWSLPMCTVGVIDNPCNGLMTRAYKLLGTEMAGSELHKAMSPVAMHAILTQFHALFNIHKYQWFMTPKSCLIVPDWCQKALQINYSARRIQTSWRRSISCPWYSICINRLIAEYESLSTGQFA
jgi:hypothetical protein